MTYSLQFLNAYRDFQGVNLVFKASHFQISNSFWISLGYHRYLPVKKEISLIIFISCTCILPYRLLKCTIFQKNIISRLSTNAIILPKYMK